MRKARKPEITLIISSSVDGCLIGRDSDELDSNKNWKDSSIVRGIVQQFFDFSPNNLNVHNLIAAQTMVRVGIKNQTFVPKKEKIKLIVMDENNQLNLRGIKNLALSVEELIIITTKEKKYKKKPYLSNCKFLKYNKKMGISHLIDDLKQKFKVSKLTIQSAGLLNSQWIDTGLVDFLTVILYPLVVSRNGTPTFIDLDEFTVRPLSLISSKVFDTNYILLRYKVIN